jgi:hypothetical protein
MMLNRRTEFIPTTHSIRIVSAFHMFAEKLQNIESNQHTTGSLQWRQLETS